MTCRDCPAGKRTMRNGHRCVHCLLYGMILKEEHECDREGWKEYDRHKDHSTDSEGTAEIPENSRCAAGQVPVVLPGSGEREGIPGMEGREKCKTIGKMLDEKITVEGMFTVVLKTHVQDGRYTFLTHNSGFDTVKTPLGMFEDDEIDNDLAMVDAAIREFYNLGGEEK